MTHASHAGLPRSMPGIALALATTRQRIASLQAKPLGDEQIACDIDALERRKFALEQDFREAFYDATGVSWHLAESIMS